ncbi:phage portal protein [Pseudolactococcus raffinolactis]|uniref:phage portal protein n=1 Tax=Pseudolactococcus raffinolactis TaxID=1366 RepID=UPI001436D83A|nr:phage portal protein [Lactococcus raffinolactis]QIW56484.1 phage portal protein [Lactococcus raffinolactis]
MGIRDYFKRSTEQQPTATSNTVGYFMKSDIESAIVGGYTKLSDSPEVTTAINTIADLVSNMTIQLMKNEDKGDTRVKNEISRLVDIAPNAYQTRKSFIFWIVKSMILNGDAVVMPITRNGAIKELRPLPNNKIRFYHDIEDGFDYVIKYKNKDYAPEDLLHFVLNPDENLSFMGTSYRVNLSDVTHNLRQASATKRSFMSSEYMPSLVMMVDSDADLDEDEREKFEEKYLKRKDKNKPLLLPDGLVKFETIKPLTLEDLAIHESVKVDKETVASILGIPSFVLGVGTYSKDEWNNFINTKIMSIAQIIQQTLNRLIVDDDMYFTFNPRSLYNYSLVEQVNAITALVKVNTLRRNEGRNWLGLAPDEEMDDLIVLENYLLQQDLSKQGKLTNSIIDDDEKGGE